MKQVAVISGAILFILILLLSVLLVKEKILSEKPTVVEELGIFYQSSKLGSNGELQIIVKNLKGADISDVKLSVEDICNSQSDSIQSNAQLTFTCLVSIGNKGDGYSHDIMFNYTDAADGLKRMVKGTIFAVYS